ncbi:MAG: hypothetical protein QOJ71_2873 [Actinomycetota bacterium]|jgi:hypothetical protein|nr:hypothetical protein [Actinomycetota bacterium]
MTQLASQRNRLAGGGLVAGGILTIVGFFVTTAVYGGNGDDRFTHPLFPALYSIGLAGTILSILGFPAILAAQKERMPRLTLVGYVGTLATIVMLNLGEGVVEAYVKPYLATHGGIPDEPRSFTIYFTVAALLMIVGLFALGVAVIRAHVFPWWVGALLIAAVPLSFVGTSLPGPLALLGDYLAFAAFIVMGWSVVRPARSRVTRAVAEVEAAA